MNVRVGGVGFELRVERGRPTEAELAALVAVLLHASATPSAGEPAAASRWAVSARPGYAVRGRPTRHGPGAWRASALPR